jgi:mannose-6-phosphate isomerase-like protein (cupin superfamily)
MTTKHAIAASAASLILGLSLAAAQDRKIEATDLDSILKSNPLHAGGPPAKVVSTARAGNSELQVLVMSKIRLHHHSQEDHVVYVARGVGIAQLENAAGRIEMRPVKPGDILSLPRGVKHAFEKAGSEDLVLLVVATAGWRPLEDTIFHD